MEKLFVIIIFIALSSLAYIIGNYIVYTLIDGDPQLAFSFVFSMYLISSILNIIRNGR